MSQILIFSKQFWAPIKTSPLVRSEADNSYKQSYHTVHISRICPYFAVLCLTKYNCPYFYEMSLFVT